MGRRWRAVAVLAVAACAGRGSGETDSQVALLSEFPSPLPPGACEVVLTPPGLPPADSLVDSASLAQEIARVWAEQEFATGHVLLTLGYDELGRNTRLDVLETSVEPAAADSGRRLVDEARRRLEREPDSEKGAGSPPPAGWGVRLRVDVGEDGVWTRVGRQEYCFPRPRDPGVEDVLVGIQAEGVRYRQGVRERTIFMNVWVHPAGYVARASVSRGVPLTTRLQQQLVDFVRQFSFFPALLDGEPVEGWIEIPVRVKG